jgi:hypothetical protein
MSTQNKLRLTFLCLYDGEIENTLFPKGPPFFFLGVQKFGPELHSKTKLILGVFSSTAYNSAPLVGQFGEGA